MENRTDTLAIALFAEIFMVDQLARTRLNRTLPKGMELSHFFLLNHLENATEPRTPAQLAKTFNLTRGAMTNTLNKLEWAGHINISPDWEDARRKLVVISPAGRRARAAAMDEIAPIITEIVESAGIERTKNSLPVLRQIRESLAAKD